ncbi:hypothetical protein GGR53DRAFT_209227 [Hypoxylon sp. FL1150]|nr:hypothetical protein GGR53DRAFT_209227 [Hypoxylon sp. FL1150]
MRVSKTSSLDDGIASPNNFKQIIFQPTYIDEYGKIIQLAPVDDVGDHPDPDFKWCVDEPWPGDDDQLSCNSDGEESVGTSSHASSLISTETSTGRVSDSHEQFQNRARTSFITWLEQGNGIFHILGKPGSGKSTFMKYLTQQPRAKEHLNVWASEKKLVIGTFFFWKPGSHLQKTIKGLIRGLLHRILSECPDLIPLAFPLQWELSMHRDVIHIEHNECQSALENLIAVSHAGSGHRFMLFIDGLDEFEGDHSYLIRQLFQWTNKSPNIKLCISSREWAIFQEAFRDCPKLHLHKLTRLDIQRFVSGRFREMRIKTLLSGNDDNRVYHLKKVIIDGSDGVFLWVSLVLRHIQEGLHNGDRIDDLMRLIRSLPTELEHMLQQLLDSIPQHNRKLAYSMFLLTRLNIPNEGVPLMQCSFLEEYTEDKNFAMNSVTNFLTKRETEMRLDRAKKRVYGVCKGFLEVRKTFEPSPNLLKDNVHFTHRSIMEFVDSPYLEEKMDMEQPTFDAFDAWCQTYLGLLKRVRLPQLFFLPDPHYRSYLFFRHRSGERDMRSIFHATRLSILGSLEAAIAYEIVLGPQGNALRFCKFLDSICRLLAGRESGTASKVLIKLELGQLMQCKMADIPIFICALHAFCEFFEYQKIAYLELASPLASACIIGFGLYYFHSEHRDLKERWPRVYKSLQVLFHNGALSSCRLPPASEPVFHTLMRRWCSDLQLAHGSLILECIAFLLFQGVNPRFAVVTSPTKDRVIDRNGKFRMGFKVYFTSGSPIGDAIYQEDTIRVGPDHLYFLLATPETFDIRNKYGHVITLRDLVSIWFPNCSAVLEQVIDWILDLGVEVDTQHRLQLQARFGHLLRPLFDPSFPGFVGSAAIQRENDSADIDNWWPIKDIVYLRK